MYIVHYLNQYGMPKTIMVDGSINRSRIESDLRWFIRAKWYDIQKHSIR